jgi:DNA polymerase-3 subunit gamma/tau
MRAAASAVHAVPAIVEPPSPAPSSTSSTTSALPDWSAIVAALELQGAPRELARNCALLGREGATVRLALDARSATMHTRALEDKLAQALSRYFGGTVRLQLELRDDAQETPARAAERVEAQRRAQARPTRWWKHLNSALARACCRNRYGPLNRSSEVTHG